MAAVMTNARGRKPRKWREPGTITAADAPFAIDEAIRSLGKEKRLQGRWRIDEAISFGRRALQVALEDAICFENHRAADQFKYFKCASDLAASAQQALEKLLDHIGASGLATGIVLLKQNRAPKSFAKSGKFQIRTSLREKPTGGFVGAKDAKDEVEALVAAADLLNEMQNYAKDQQKKLEHTQINDADHGKRAFVYRLAEAWIFLTGKKPGKGRDASHNPFLTFVEAAANDAGGFEEDFYRALEGALKTLTLYESFDRAGESGQSISGIAARGPAWA